MNNKKRTSTKQTPKRPHPMPRKPGISKSRGYKDGGKLCK